ncbi:hypothetical protein PVK06_007288 [Gossypium arboreum]|uniref:RNase H type-1 domain-containing protein n=1 Tax=Gossypium arboreum TaxID=29729 RepID=A0ABR0QGX6_GOSAR|nr:hypothetical protein PVK06_007288 [Gossypium arboreum]
MGWVKLNTDGAMPPNSSNALDTIFRVEAHAMLEGLRIARDRGNRQLEIECDNALLVECLLMGCTINSSLAELV